MTTKQISGKVSNVYDDWHEDDFKIFVFWKKENSIESTKHSVLINSENIFFWKIYNCFKCSFNKEPTRFSCI